MSFPSDVISVIERRYSTTTPLAGAATFSGPGNATIDMGTFVAIVVSVIADQDGTLYAESSPDGTNWDDSTSQAVTANTRAEIRVAPAYITARVRYLNGATPQTSMRLQTTLHRDLESVGQGVSAPGGGALATAAKQDTAHTDAAAILAKFPAALGAGGGIKVDGSGTALPISAASLPLPTLAATSTIQTDKSQFTQIAVGATAVSPTAGLPVIDQGQSFVSAADKDGSGGAVQLYPAQSTPATMVVTNRHATNWIYLGMTGVSGVTNGIAIAAGEKFVLRVPDPSLWYAVNADVINAGLVR